MDEFLYIVVAALLVVLCLAQIALAIHQLRKGAPDGKLLLIINSCMLVVWTPLSIFKFLYPKCLPLVIVWFIIAAAYIIFSLWYTNNLTKSFPKK